jgi:UDP-N-acetylmuramate--alanine ligase
MKKFSFPADLHGFKIHFVGIKGTGMAALVEILFARGAEISGSDVSEKFYTDEILEKLKIIVQPFSGKNVTPDISLVIHSSAYSVQKNPDLIRAAELKIPCILYSEALGLLSETSYSAGICGVHGKTTTTGMAGTLLMATDLPVQVLAGSVISSFGNSCTVTSRNFSDLIESNSAEQNFGEQNLLNRNSAEQNSLNKNSTEQKFGEQNLLNRNSAEQNSLNKNSAEQNSAVDKKIFVAETCEYQRHFMAFCPKKIVLTSVESDHQDFYPTFADIQNAFVDYACKLPSGGDLIFCADDPGAAETAKIVMQKRPDINFIPYGEKAEGDFKIVSSGISCGEQKFKIGNSGEFVLKIPGLHNQKNAAAAVALVSGLLKDAGKNPQEYSEKLKVALKKFSGGKRRSEIVGRKKNSSGDEIIFIDDYGHHPTAIKTTLEGYRNFYRGHKIVVDFMSHTYTRTAALLEEFAESFSSADFVVINKIYASAREDVSSAKVSGKILAEKTSAHHKNVFYAEEFDEAAEKIFSELQKKSGAEFSDGYVFVTMGAGDNWKVGKIVMEKFSEGKK